MTFPVFASGDVLNASDMNAVGLWLVKTQTIGSAVNSVTVTGAFSADYDNYRIVVGGGAGSSVQSLALQLGSTTTGYYGGFMYTIAGSTTVTGGSYNNTASISDCGRISGDSINMICDVLNPFLSKQTYVQFNYGNGATTTNFLQLYGGAYVNNTTSYTAFTLTAAGAATMTGGVIRVYGYRN